MQMLLQLKIQTLLLMTTWMVNLKPIKSDDYDGARFFKDANVSNAGVDRMIPTSSGSEVANGR